jgi:hypothetical protein
MRRASTVVITVVLITAALGCAPVALASAKPPRVIADAGLAGVSKAGRWTPVRVIVDNTGEDFSGELVVTWGDFESRRDIALPAPSRKRYQVYARTGDGEGAIKVQLVSRGVEIRAIEVPIRIVPPDEPIRVCVAPPSAQGLAVQESCSATITADTLPDSPRGYDAVDGVFWPLGNLSIGADQRIALDRWQPFHALEAAGDLDVTPRALPPSVRRGLPAHSRQLVATFAVLYGVALVITGVWLARRGVRAAVAYATVALLVCVGSSAALAIGRAGPASDIVIHHTTLVQQFPGEVGSLVTMRGMVEFPALDSYALRASLADGFIEVPSPSGGRKQALDEDGHALLRGTFPLGSRRGFLLEGFASLNPLEMKIDGGVLRVTNRSSLEMSECRFVEGFSVGETGTLRPSQTVEAKQQAEVTGPVFSCVLPDLPVAFSEPARVVRTQGEARIFLYKPR